MKKRILSILFAVVLCATVLSTAVAAELMGAPTLIDGIGISWIDRLNLTTDDEAAIRKFYDTLAEASDNDGTDDFLIEDEYFNKAEGESIKVATVTGTITGVYDEATATAKVSKIVSDTLAVYSKYIEAVWAAFDRDHPEVFWLGGSALTNASASYSMTAEEVTYKIEIQFVLKSAEFDIRAEGYRSESDIKAAIAEFSARLEYLSGQASTKASDKEKIEYFNEQLTKTNEYNTGSNLNAIPHDCREATSALLGRVGEEGPVCEGYARAFKVLCDKAGIPCVLVDGDAKSSISSLGEAHMWNYVQLEGAWFAVDVTWNDPSAQGISGAVSGCESEDWLLVGSETVIGGMKFIRSHPVKNLVTVGGIAFVNGPALSELSLNDLIKQENPYFTDDMKNIYWQYGQTITLSAKGGLGTGAITYTVTGGTGEATLNGNTLTATKAGTVQVIAHKAGDGEYAGGSSEPLELTIHSARPDVAVEYTYVTEAGKTLNDIGLKLTVTGINGEKLTGALSWYKLADVGGTEVKLPVNANDLLEPNTRYVFTLSLDNENYSDGEDRAIFPWPVHDWSYTVKDGKLIGKCAEKSHTGKIDCGSTEYELCYPDGKYTYEEVMSGRKAVYYYNGKGKAAFITCYGNSGEDLPIIYYKWNGSEWTLMPESEVPTDTGKYKASVTAGRAEVSVEYEICYMETNAVLSVKYGVCTLAELWAPEGFGISRTPNGKYEDHITIPTGMRPETARVTIYLKETGSEDNFVAEMKVVVSLNVCKDSAGDGDHTCDKCGNTEVLSEHTYSEATCKAPATCTECGEEKGERLSHKDSSADGDHVCDHGCGEVLEPCFDGDGNGLCDVCASQVASAPAVTLPPTAPPTTPDMPKEPIGAGGCAGAPANGAEPMLLGGTMLAILGASMCKKRKKK